MSPDPSRLPDVSAYAELLDRFIEGRIAAPEFEAFFLVMIKSEHRILGEPIYSVLQELFEDVDAYVERPELRTGADDLGDEQLRVCALRTRRGLRDLGQREQSPMIEPSTWRPISSEESGIIRAIVLAAGIPGGDDLVNELDGALVANATPWILDVRVSVPCEGTDLPDGPFPARAFVPSNAAYQGEIIIWVAKGRVSGLEYAWIGDEAPKAWPGQDAIEVVAR